VGCQLQPGLVVEQDLSRIEDISADSGEEQLQDHQSEECDGTSAQVSHR
jgi:hypothetical protein